MSLKRKLDTVKKAAMVRTFLCGIQGTVPDALLTNVVVIYAALGSSTPRTKELAAVRVDQLVKALVYLDEEYAGPLTAIGSCLGDLIVEHEDVDEQDRFWQLMPDPGVRYLGVAGKSVPLLLQASDLFGIA